MNVSSELVQILKNREDLRLTSYLDQAGVYTIGWGVTSYENGAAVKKGEKITQARAVELLNYHIRIAENAINDLVSAELSQGQFDALVSFVYNVGRTGFQGSTLRKLVNANPDNTTVIAAEFSKWVYVTKNNVKVISNGLVNRRAEEIAIYVEGAGGVKKKRRSRSLSL